MTSCIGCWMTRGRGLRASHAAAHAHASAHVTTTSTPMPASTVIDPTSTQRNLCPKPARWFDQCIAFGRPRSKSGSCLVSTWADAVRSGVTGATYAGASCNRRRRGGMRVGSAAANHSCPPPRPGPPPPPAPIPPGAPRDFRGVRCARTTSVWWRTSDQFSLQLGVARGSGTGYGRWADAIAAAAEASRGRAGAVAICDDRGRLYLREVIATCWFGSWPLRIGERSETGYAFLGNDVRGIVDGDLVVSRGDCLHPWVGVPTASR